MKHKLNIAVYGNRRQHENSVSLRRLILALVLDGAEVSMHEKLYDHLNHELGLEMSGVRRVSVCPPDASLAISVGGDGTFLRTVAWLEGAKIPILGINTGHLGYLTAISLDEALADTAKICNIDFRYEELSMIAVHADHIEGSAMALNEVVVAKEDSASMISAVAHINEHLLADYKADGLIVATPTGSTAYNLSVGGPIVQPIAPVWVVSPIAAHSLTLRPLVVSDDSEITVTVSGRGSRFRLVLDGRVTSLPLGSTIRLKRAAHKVTLLQRHDRDFAKIIGQKLMFNG